VYSNTSRIESTCTCRLFLTEQSARTHGPLPTSQFIRGGRVNRNESRCAYFRVASCQIVLSCFEHLGDTNKHSTSSWIVILSMCLWYTHSTPGAEGVGRVKRM
jgi:hypothetical protein